MLFIHQYLWLNLYVSNVLVIPDIHAPFQHKQTVPFLKHIQAKFACNRVVCLGDEMDYHALSRFPKDPDGHGAGYEHQLGKEWLKRELYPAFPVVDVCTSNHTARIFRKAYDAGIPAELILPYKAALEAPDGWNWKDRHTIDGVDYIHGEGYTGQNAHVKAAKDNRRSTVIGHVHGNAGVQYFQTVHDRIFGLNAGCLIDIDAYAFRYGKTYASKPTLGCGVVLNGIHAFFIPLHEGVK